MNVSQTSIILCCGCGVCSLVCGKSAISMTTNEFGFLYPKIDTDKCNDCSLCVEKCTVMRFSFEYKNTAKPKVYAAWLINKEYLLKSSSGGVFYALAERILELGGYVCGAIYTNDFRKVTHVVSNQVSEIARMRGSKYCQSDKKSVYLEIKQLLEANNFVLFTGLPCEVAGLKKYLSRDYDKLLCVDLICHGPLSPRILNEYIDYLEKGYNSKVKLFTMRYKKTGWLPLYLEVEFCNGIKIQKPYYDTLYGRIFGKQMAMRPSCYKCIFKRLPLIGDITLGDFKGIEKILTNYNRNGVSVVIINNLKGNDFFKEISRLLEIYETDLAFVLENNRRLMYPVKSPLADQQMRFWDVLNCEGIEMAVNTLPKKNFLQRIIRKLARVLKIHL